MTDRLHTIEAGSRSLPTTVLLHGFGGNAEVWRNVIDAMEGRAHVLAFDLPGHGGSLNYLNFGSPRVAASAVAQEMKLRGIDRFHVVGHSMGGAVAVLVALDGPENVASLTLLAPGGFGAEINADTMHSFATATSRGDMSVCFAMMSGRGADAPETRLSTAAAMRAKPGQIDALALILAKIMRDGRQGQLPLDALAALPIPVQILWGDADAVVPVEQLIAAPGQFKKTILKSAGHMLIDEKPDAVIDAILGPLT